MPTGDVAGHAEAAEASRGARGESPGGAGPIGRSGPGSFGRSLSDRRSDPASGYSFAQNPNVAVNLPDEVKAGINFGYNSDAAAALGLTGIPGLSTIGGVIAGSSMEPGMDIGGATAAHDAMGQGDIGDPSGQGGDTYSGTRPAGIGDAFKGLGADPQDNMYNAALNNPFQQSNSYGPSYGSNMQLSDYLSDMFGSNTFGQPKYNSNMNPEKNIIGSGNLALMR